MLNNDIVGHVRPSSPTTIRFHWLDLPPFLADAYREMISGLHIYTAGSGFRLGNAKRDSFYSIINMHINVYSYINLYIFVRSKI